MEKTFKLELTGEEVKEILQALSERPWKNVDFTIRKIGAQIEQSKEQPKTKPKREDKTEVSE